MDIDDLTLEYREVKPPLMLDFCGIDHSSPFCFGCQKTKVQNRNNTVINSIKTLKMVHIKKKKVLMYNLIHETITTVRSANTSASHVITFVCVCMYMW